MIFQSPLLRTVACTTLVVALLATASVAQQSPKDLGLGTKRGIQQMQSSGQVGTVTLFRRGSHVFVDIRMHGVPGGKVERVGIYRIADCDHPIGQPASYLLHDLIDAQSATSIDAALATLLSGNYSVVISSREKPQHTFACGHLFG